MNQPNKSHAPDPFFPSGQFAKVPAELLSWLGHSGPAGLSHAEFRLLVALCRYRGVSRLVYPTRASLERATGISPNNVSRITRSLHSKGWLTIHYEAGDCRRKVVNYELRFPASQPALPLSSNAVTALTQQDTPPARDDEGEELGWDDFDFDDANL